MGLVSSKHYFNRRVKFNHNDQEKQGKIISIFHSENSASFSNFKFLICIIGEGKFVQKSCEDVILIDEYLDDMIEKKNN